MYTNVIHVYYLEPGFNPGDPGKSSSQCGPSKQQDQGKPHKSYMNPYKEGEYRVRFSHKKLSFCIGLAGKTHRKRRVEYDIYK